MQKLSPYQTKIGRLVARGYSNRDIALELKTSEQAIKSAIHAAFDKTGAGNRVELAALLAHDFSLADEGADAAAAKRIEDDRLSMLQEITKADRTRQEALDDLVSVAATLCNTPIALVSLLEAHRLWFTAEIGMHIREVARRASFCDHASQGSILFQIKDATQDERFRQHPFVCSDPHIRFYAGLPLLNRDGNALGTLCVIDRVPRELNPAQQQGLTRLARLAQKLLTGAVDPMRKTG